VINDDNSYKIFFEKQDVNIKSVDRKFLTNDYLEGLDNNPIRPILDETEDGYFYFDEHNYIIMFYDKKSKDSIIFCNKPNCSHSNPSEECTSFTFKYRGYYDGYLYTVSDDEKMVTLQEGKEFIPQSVVNYYLTRVKIDGTDKETITKLYTVYFEKNEKGLYIPSDYIHDYTFHRGYFYHTLSSQFKGETIIFLKRCNLENHEEEVIISQKLVVKLRLISSLKGYGPHIYFIDRRYYSEDFQDNDAKLCRVYIDTGVIEEINVDINIQDYFIMDKYMYYVLKPGNLLYKMDLETKESELIIELTDETYLPYLSNITIDHDYIYINNLNHNIDTDEDYDKECRVYDKKGNLVDVIDLDGNYIRSDKTFGVSGDKLVIAWASEKNSFAYDYYTLDKSQIGTGIHTLEKLIESAD
jgi:hypothetical protein